MRPPRGDFSVASRRRTSAFHRHLTPETINAVYADGYERTRWLSYASYAALVPLHSCRAAAGTCVASFGTSRLVSAMPAATWSPRSDVATNGCQPRSEEDCSCGIIRLAA